MVGSRTLPKLDRNVRGLSASRVVFDSCVNVVFIDTNVNIRANPHSPCELAGAASPRRRQLPCDNNADMNPLITFRLADEFLAQAASATTKAERSRLGLLAAAADVLDDVPFPQLRPADLAAHAGISRSLIYHYYADLAELTTALVDSFSERVRAVLPTLPVNQGDYSYASILAYLAWTVSVVLRNRGVYRVMATQADQLPAVKAAYEQLLYIFNKDIGSHVDAPPVLRFGRTERLFAGYFVGGGFENLMRQVFVDGKEDMPPPRTSKALFEMVQLVAVLRNRQVHGCDPSEAEIRAAAADFDMRVFEGCFKAARSAPASAQASVRPASMPRLRRMANKVSAKPAQALRDK